MKTMMDITPGESWACRFRCTTWLDANGKPQPNEHVAVGTPHPGTPGEYSSIGVIRVRDTQQRLVLVEDIESAQEFTISWDNCWDIDSVEWIGNEQE